MMQLMEACILILFISSPLARSYVGRVNNTRFTSVDRTNPGSLWLSWYGTWSQCMRSVLQSNFSDDVLAMNSYTNGSCQLFTQLPSTYTMETNKNSTLILFKPLPPPTFAPCCSNLLWLISTINSSQQASLNVTSPSFVVIDERNNLATMSYTGPLVQFNRSTMALTRTSTPVSLATGISYYNGMYYIRE